LKSSPGAAWQLAGSRAPVASFVHLSQGSDGDEPLRLVVGV
jgi:hypothetical protein